MALIKCSECGKEISDKAAACVNCGCPVSASVAKATQASGIDPLIQELFEFGSKKTSAASEAIGAIKAYKPNQFVQFLHSRRFWTLAFLYVGAVVYLLIEDGLYMASAGAAGMAPFFVPLIIARFIYPFHHVKKYFESRGVDIVLRRESDINLAIAAYNAMPSQKMVNYIKSLNAPLYQELEKMIAAKKAAK